MQSFRKINTHEEEFIAAQSLEVSPVTSNHRAVKTQDPGFSLVLY